MDKILSYLNEKYKNINDFKIIGNNIYSKTAISYQTLTELNKLQNVKAVFYLTEMSLPYQKGYRLGICLG